MNVKGKIHSTETMGAVDGPGIRYVVFMQGCLLKCLYCHNRDTWDLNGGKEISVDEIIEDIKRYLDFITLSNGGITVTGGEPTLQVEFVKELFKRCKELRIHTALDTSGFVDNKDVEELLKYTNLVLLDIKHANDEKHKEITGVSNKKTIEFAKNLSDKGIDIWIRYVLVPGYTDNTEDLLQARKIIDNIKTVKKVEVLPYHTMGKYKWEQLGKEYILEKIDVPTKEQIDNAQKILGG